MKETRREKEEERKWDGTGAPGGLLRKRLGSCIWGNPLTGGEIAAKEGELQGLLEDSAGRTETYADRLCPNLRLVFTSEHGGWLLLCDVWEAN